MSLQLTIKTNYFLEKYLFIKSRVYSVPSVVTTDVNYLPNKCLLRKSIADVSLVSIDGRLYQPTGLEMITKSVIVSR